MPSLLAQWSAMSGADQALLVGAFFIAVLALYATVIEPNRLQHNVVEVHIRDLASAFDGYRIVVLADVHHLPSVTPKLARAVSMANASNPDLTVLLGDYAASWHHQPRLSRWSYRYALKRIGPLLATLKAKDGVLAVLGNHDYYSEASTVLDWLRRCGVKPLVNDHVLITRSDATIVIAGLDDLWAGQLDARSGCANAPPHAPTVVLSHNPDGVLHLDANRRVDLVLSGHTHGGQVVFPMVGALVRHAQVCGPHTASGLVPNPRALLFVSRGVGEQMPLRFRCPPEVVTIVLRAQAKSS